MKYTEYKYNGRTYRHYDGIGFVAPILGKRTYKTENRLKKALDSLVQLSFDDIIVIPRHQ